MREYEDSETNPSVDGSVKTALVTGAGSGIGAATARGPGPRRNAAGRLRHQPRIGGIGCRGASTRASCADGCDVA